MEGNYYTQEDVAKMLNKTLKYCKSDDDRLRLMQTALDGYCIHCGAVESTGRRCQCTNDE